MLGAALGFAWLILICTGAIRKAIAKICFRTCQPILLVAYVDFRELRTAAFSRRFSRGRPSADGGRVRKIRAATGFDYERISIAGIFVQRICAEPEDDGCGRRAILTGRKSKRTARSSHAADGQWKNDLRRQPQQPAAYGVFHFFEDDGGDLQ